VTDRRDPTRADRRRLHLPLGGRRATDPLPPHGTRVRYQRGCCCLLCRSAESEYQTTRRRLQASGKAPLGSLVDAGPTWRRIRDLLREGYTRTQIGRALGLKHPRLQLDPQTVKVEMALKVKRLHRLWLGDGD
jgi:hypothetical protein